MSYKFSAVNEHMRETERGWKLTSIHRPLVGDVVCLDWLDDDLLLALLGRQIDVHDLQSHMCT